MFYKKLFLLFSICLFLGFAQSASAHLPRIIYNQSTDIQVKDPEISQSFYDELGGKPRNYLISSDKDFNFYINLLVPSHSNANGKYSAKVFLIKDNNDQEIAFIDGQTDFLWKEFYEPFSRDYYFKGPEFEKTLPAGDYKITVFNYENRGKYVLAIGKEEQFPLLEILNIYLTLPLLKIEFFKTSILEFFLTPFGLVVVGLAAFLLIIMACGIFISFINEVMKGRKPKMLLLTSSGMSGTKEEILSVLPKPADKIRVAHIITASKVESDISYVEKDRELMKEAGFNVEDVDIEGKNKDQLMKLLENFDIIYVQGGNTFYLLKQMRRSGFDKIIKKLLRKGIVYIGVSAGSIVAGKTIQTASWQDDEDKFGLINLRGLGFVKSNIFVHYNPEYEEIIKQKPKRIKKSLRILTDEQALFVFGKKTILVGEGDAITIK
ncbi:MAG: Type 1 glutamine amidotransferase-like domain-containing protein [Candidatus Staskawiczbacteria bacterium]|nr:Type 1 glutamine amidotransferase-like domain-containing protein [Candidatus Staskawiczbacteria bacterium]